MKSKLLLALVAVFVAYAGWISGAANAEIINSGTLTGGDDSPGLITSIPRIMSYQGMLRSAEGDIPDGIYNITFRIYLGPDDIDPIWDETYPCTTSSGFFTAVLGRESPLDLPFDVPYYLSLQVQGDPEMQPYQELTMSPYSARSDTCDYAINRGGWVDDGTVVRLETSTDYVGIGTESPATKVEIAGEATEDLLRIKNTTGDQNKRAWIRGYGGDPPAEQWLLGNGWVSGTSNFFIRAGETAWEPQFFLNSTTGNVGIGTISPTNRLHVVGSSSGPDPIALVEQAADGRGLRVNTPTGMCAIVSESGNHGLRVVEAGRPENPGADGVHVMHAWHNGIHVVDAGNDGIHVDNAGGWAGYFGGTGCFTGDVCIGTTTPAANLHVSGSGQDVVRINSSFPLAGIRFAMNNQHKGMIGYGDICGGGDSDAMTMCSENEVLQFGDPYTGTHLTIKSGKVGIGTTDPNEKLDLAGNLRFTEQNLARKIYVEKSDGEDEPGRNLEIYAGEYSDAGFAETKYGGDLILHGGRGYGLAGGDVFIYGGTGLLANPIGDVIMAHDGSVSGGNVGIATSDPTEKLDVDGTARLRGISSAMQEMSNVVVDDNGVLWKEPGSSLRYKENIRRLNVDPDEVLKLQPVEFEWKASGGADIGLIAEDVDRIFPNLVRYDEEGNPDGVRYDKVVLYLLELVKAQQQKMAMLEREIAEFKGSSQ